MTHADRFAAAICALSARRTRATKLAFVNALTDEMQRGLVSIIPLPLFAATVRIAWSGRTLDRDYGARLHV